MPLLKLWSSPISGHRRKLITCGSTSVRQIAVPLPAATGVSFGGAEGGDEKGTSESSGHEEWTDGEGGRQTISSADAAPFMLRQSFVVADTAP